MHRLLAAALLCALPGITNAQGHEHPSGHAERLGRVRFATSCRPSTARTFDRAVALLHSFEFGAAIRGFSDVLAVDSSCAMAYWGIALSRWTNPMAAGQRSAPQLRAGQEAVDAGRRVATRATARERGYIDAVATLFDSASVLDQGTRMRAYAAAMQRVVRIAPADTEAKIFHAIALTAAASPTDKTYANQLKAGAILEALWAAQPNHPGLAHYIIHTYDVPALAARGQAAAEKYASIAPSASHAQHMPSHIFTRVGAWDESVRANLRSMEVARRDNIAGEELHASDYLVYAYLQLGRDDDARRVMNSLPEIQKRFDPTAITGAAPGSAGVFALAAIPARYALERRAWSEAASLAAPPSAFPWTEAMDLFARALGATHLRDLPRARAAADTLSSIQRRLVEMKEPYWAEQVAIQELGARAWIELASGDTAAALEHIREAAARESATEKNAVTPGPLAPARELLGDMLVDVGRPKEALAEYEASLQREPNRLRGMLGALQAAQAAHDSVAMERYVRPLSKLRVKKATRVVQ